MVPTDAELVSKACNEDMDAYQTLVERYKRRVYYTALGIVGNHHDAEDVLQESLLQALRSLPKLRHPQGFGSWLLKIAYNRSIDHRRRRSREVEPEINEDGTEVFDTMENKMAISNPEKSINSNEISHAVRRTMEELPESQRTAFSLKHISQLSIRDIAIVTSSSEATVKTNIYRAVQKMRHSLAPLVGGFAEAKTGKKVV